MKNRHNLFFSILLLLFSCGGRKETPFPLHETEWLKPKTVPIGKTDTITLPENLPIAGYTTVDGKLIKRDQNIPLVKPITELLGRTEPQPTGLEAIPIPKNLPMAEYTTQNAKLLKRDRNIPLMPPKRVPLGKTDTIQFKGKVVIAKPPKSVQLGELGMKDNDMFGIRVLGQDQGLPGTNANCMLQDRSGRLWVGTNNGLACLEGKEMKVYNLENGLSNNNVMRLLEDSKGRLWIATFGGLNLLDGDKGFTHYTVENGLSNNTVLSLSEDSKGRLWIGTYGGLNMLDYDKGIVRYTVQNGLSNNIVLSLLEDRKGRLWIGSPGGLSLLDGDKGFTHYMEENGLSNHIVKDIFEDGKGRLWIATDGGGLNLLDGDKGFVHYTVENGLSNNHVLRLFGDRKGKLWIGTDGGGLNLLDDDKGFVRYTTENGLSNNTVFSIFGDSKGKMWIGTDGGGLNLLDGDKGFVHYTVEKGIANNRVRSLLEDRKGRLWIGTSDGLNLLDGDKGFQHYTTEHGLYKNTVRGLLEDSKGRMWMGTPSGLNLLVGDKGFVHYKIENGLSTNSVRSVLEDKKGKLWIGTYGGLNMLDENKGFFHYTVENGLANNTVVCLLEDDKERLWIGTYGGGLNLLDGDRGFVRYSVENGLSNNYIRVLLEDSKGRLWVGTEGGGLNLMDGDKGFTHFNISDGLADNTVLQLAQDSLGHIWAGTNKGLTRLIERKDGDFQLKSWTKEHGFKYIDFFGGDNTMLFDKNGTMWTGTGQALTAFKTPSPDSIAPMLFLTQVDVDGKTADWRKLSSLKKLADTLWLAGQDSFLLSANFPPDTSWLSRAGFSWEKNDALAPYFLPIGLQAPYTHNHLTFRYSGLKLGEQGDVVYRYMLEGLDTEWSPFTKDTKADYRNIPPGEYTFKVRARSGDYVWSGENVFSFEVLPPWHRTWWAYSLYAILAGLGVFGAVKANTLRLEADKKRLKGIVEERTRDLMASNEEIQQQNEEITQQSDEIASQRDGLQKSYENIRLMSDIGKEITRHISVEGIIATVYAEVNKLMPADGFGIGVFNEKENRMDFPGYIEKGEKLPFFSDDLHDDDSFSDWCFRHQKEVMIGDQMAEYGAYLSKPPVAMAGELAVSLIYLPLIVQEKALGNITVQSFQKNAYTENHLNLFRNIALYTAIALDNASAYEKVEIEKEKVEREKEKVESAYEKLDLEKEKSEKLLLNILPKETADELKEKGRASTKYYKKVTVLFTDFKGFTQMTEKMHPEEVVENLNHCFTAFDRICKKHRIEKIKTIGDSYMCAAGIPTADDDNPERMVEAALEMLGFIQTWKAEKAALGEQVWDLRLGLHTGPVMAGVVGEDKFAYDIWGDTVNTASRMESSGEPSMINISEATYQLVKDRFHCTYRGEVQAKNKGMMGMYFVSIKN